MQIQSNTELRGKIRDWLRPQIEGSEKVHLPELARRAAQEFTDQLNEDQDSLNVALPDMLFFYAYDIGTRLIHGTRGGLDKIQPVVHAADLADGVSWMEHAGDKHLRLSAMEASDLMASAGEREKRARTELRIASTFRQWAKNLEGGEKIGAYLSKHSPREPIIYLAGKVGGSSDWRCKILEQFEPTEGEVLDGSRIEAVDRGYGYSHYKNFALPVLHGHVYDAHLHPYTGPGTWPKIKFREGFSYVGPYYRDMWGGHGVGNEDWDIDHAGEVDLDLGEERYHQSDGLVRPAIHRACLEAIRAASHIFLWLDNARAYGTLVEVGFAHALGKPIYAAISQDLLDKRLNNHNERTLGDEFWFSLQCAQHVDEVGGSPEEAFDNFLLWAGAPVLPVKQ